MIWIPISIVLTLFGLHSFMVRSLECDQNLVEGVSEEAAEALGEVCALQSNGVAYGECEDTLSLATMGFLW